MNVNSSFRAGHRPGEVQKNSETAVVPRVAGDPSNWICRNRQSATARSEDVSDDQCVGMSRVAIDDEDWQRYNDVRNGRVMDGPGNSRAWRSVIAILALIWEEEYEYIAGRLFSLEKEGLTYAQIYKIIDQELQERAPAIEAERDERERQLRDPEMRKNVQIRTRHEALLVSHLEQEERSYARLEQARQRTAQMQLEVEEATERTMQKNLELEQVREKTRQKDLEIEQADERFRLMKLELEIARGGAKKNPKVKNRKIPGRGKPTEKFESEVKDSGCFFA